MQLKSYNEILGQLVRKLKADSNLTDLNVGSVIRTLLEAVAQNDFENSASIMSILQLSNIDSVSGSDLDKKASEFGITRFSAQKSTGTINIYDPSVIETTSTLYIGKPAPIKGQSSIYLTDASEFKPTGTIFIGRGSISYELVSYSQKIFHGAFWELILSSSLINDHFVTDVVEDSKNAPDRKIPSGTRVTAISLSGALEYRTTTDVVLPAGKREIKNVPVESVGVGFKYNIASNKISDFVAPPFVGAKITQEFPIINGKDIESDQSFRTRLKSHSEVGLTKGTVSSIINAVLGINHPQEGEIFSASYSDTEPATLWIDNNTILPPNYKGIAVDTILESATGNEKIVKLNQYPIARPTLISKEGPFSIRNSILRIILDDVDVIDIEFKREDFVRPDSVSVQDVASHINISSNLLHARIANNKIYLAPSDANVSVIGTEVPNEDFIEEFDFDNIRTSSLLLYRNLELLSPVAKKATVNSVPIENWLIQGEGSLIISVDGTPSQTVNITTEDFSFVPFSFISIEEWARVLNSKISGATVIANYRTLSISSNLEGTQSSIQVIGGTYLNNMFSQTKATGSSKDYELNRMSGHIKLLTKLQKGDKLSAGLLDFRSVLTSKSQKQYSFIINNDGDIPELFIAKDAVIRRSLPPEIEVTISSPSTNIMKVELSSKDFATAQIGDWLYIISSTLTITGNRGIYQIIKKGDSFVEVLNPTVESQSFTTIKKDELSVFGCSGFPIRINLEGEQSLEQVLFELVSKKLDAYKRKDSIRISSLDGSNLGVPVSSGTMKNFLDVSSFIPGGQSQSAISYSTGLTPKFTYNQTIQHKNQVSEPLTDTFLSGSQYVGIFSDRWTSEIFRLANTEYPTVNKDFTVEIEGPRFHSDDNLLVRVGPNVEHAIRIPISRQGQVKSTFASTDKTFSAWDRGGELNSDFSSNAFWGSINLDGFRIITRAKNFYKSYSGAEFILRAKEYGINGSKVKFSIITPTNPNVSSQISVSNLDIETIVNYTLGSDESKYIQLSNGEQLSITRTSESTLKLDFLGLITNLSSVDTGDIFTITTESGLPSSWIGSFAVTEAAQNSVTLVNPEGTETYQGIIQTTEITLPNDVPASSTVSNITCGTPIDGSAFYLYGVGGQLFVFYFNLGTPLIPGIYGGIEFECTDVLSGDSPETVASKVANHISTNWSSDFNVELNGSILTITNTVAGPYPSAQDSPTATHFTFAFTPYVAPVSVDGKYFTAGTESGIIAFWYKINTSPTFVIGDHTVTVNVTTGMSASDIASATRQAMVTYGLSPIPETSNDKVTFTASAPARYLGTSQGTMTVSISETLGEAPTYAILQRAAGVKVFSLIANSATAIVNNINTLPYLEATLLTEGNISLSTQDEPYPVAHEHSYGEIYVGLFDYENIVSSFQQSNPYFTCQDSFVMEDYPTTKLSAIKNNDGSFGEYFRLVPNTQRNAYEFLSSKTISSLPLLVQISHNDRIILRQREPGSTKFIEISGEANSISYPIDSDVTVQSGREFFNISVQSSSLQSGDLVKLETSDAIPKAQSTAVIYKDENFSVLSPNEIITDIPSHAQFTFSTLSPNVFAFDIEDCGNRIRLKKKSEGTISVILPAGTATVISTSEVEFDLQEIPVTGQSVIVTVNGTDFIFSLVNSVSKNESTRLLASSMKLNLQFISLISVFETEAKLFSVIPMDSKITFNEPTVPQDLREAIVFPSSKNRITLYSSHALSIFEDSSFSIKPNFLKKLYLDFKPRLEVDFIEGTVITLKNKHHFVNGQTISTSSINAVIDSVIDDYSFSTTEIISTDYVTEGSVDFVQVRKLSGNLYAMLFNSNKNFTSKYIQQQDRLLFSCDQFRTHGEYEIVSVSNDCLIFKNNNNDQSEIFGYNIGTEVLWVHNSNIIKGSVGDFRYVSINDYIRKFSDDVSLEISVERFLDNNNQSVSSELATQVVLTSKYNGESGFSSFCSHRTDIEIFGRYLTSYDDIQIFKYWGADVGDEVFIESQKPSNKGTFKIVDVSSDFIKYENPNTIEESSVLFTVFSDSQRYSQIKRIENSQINYVNRTSREIFVYPVNEKDTMFKKNSTISKVKLGFDNDSYGTDAFRTVQGLVLEAQRTIDGYPSNPVSYPGIKAAGAHIEVLPPIARLIRVSIDVELNDSVRSSEVFANIKSAVINFIGAQKVGAQIATSSIISVVMSIYGVQSAKIVFPTSTFISFGEGEKGYATQESIEVY